MSMCPSSAWDSLCRDQERIEDADIMIGDIVRDGARVLVRLYEKGDISGYDMLIKMEAVMSKARDTADDFMESYGTGANPFSD